MKPKTGGLFEHRPLCAWPGCRRGPNVEIEYGAAPTGLDTDPPIGWQPAPAGGVISLCRGHSVELREALGPKRIRSETPLP